MANMVTISVLVALTNRESQYVRQGLWAMKLEIDYKDETDLEKVDMKKLEKAMEPFVKPDPLKKGKS
jgi:hypothetical protein